MFLRSLRKLGGLKKSHLLSCFGGTLVFAAFGSSPWSLRRGLTSWLLIVEKKNAVVARISAKELTRTLVTFSACTELLEHIQVEHKW